MVSPTGSYAITLPVDVKEDVDGRVTSYWMPGDETLLQVSSYRRESGDQPTAEMRMDARLSSSALSECARVAIEIEHCPDVAASSGKDPEDGGWWLYVYAVWPDLTVLLTVAHPDALPNGASWVMGSVRSLCRPDGSA